MSWEDKFYDHLLGIDADKRKQRDEFVRLCVEPSAKVPKKGDRVVVAAGFIGLGHDWAREEAVVEEVGDTAVKVRFLDYKPYGAEKGSFVKWIHPALVTDVLEAKP